MTIFLRKLPQQVQNAIEEISRRENISLSRAAIRLLESSLRKVNQNNDFDEFCGVWSQAEADEFDSVLLQMRPVEQAFAAL